MNSSKESGRMALTFFSRSEPKEGAVSLTRKLMLSSGKPKHASQTMIQTSELLAFNQTQSPSKCKQQAGTAEPVLHCFSFYLVSNQVGESARFRLSMQLRFTEPETLSDAIPRKVCSS